MPTKYFTYIDGVDKETIKQDVEKTVLYFDKERDAFYKIENDEKIYCGVKYLKSRDILDIFVNRIRKQKLEKLLDKKLNCL